MFLDDKLYEHVKSYTIHNGKDFEQMINELFAICENEWKSQISVGSAYAVNTAAMDRVFSAWDLLTKRLTKEQWPFLRHLPDFRKHVLNDPQVREIYMKGKRNG